MIILDTDHVSFLENENPAANRLNRRLRAASAERLRVTVVSYEEQTRGWMARLAKMRDVAEQIGAYRRLAEQLRNYCAWLMLEFDEVAAVQFQQLRGSRVRIGTMDLKIAAIALVHDATLLTRNTSDFAKVPGLRIENWIDTGEST